MIHPHTKLVTVSERIGFGVEVTQFIPKGTIVWTLCSFDIVMSPERVSQLREEERKISDIYGYVDHKGDTVLCWDLGRYVNHSCHPAMLPIDHYSEIAVRDLYPGEQMTCDYSTLNYPSSLRCACGHPSCRDVVSSKDALNDDTNHQELISKALESVSVVQQPLMAFVQNKNELLELVSGVRKPLRFYEYLYISQD